MPIPIAAIGLGMAGGVAFEYVTSAGRPTKKGLVTSAVIGALPVGLGFRAGARESPRLGSCISSVVITLLMSATVQRSSEPQVRDRDTFPT